jgi:hypothetical protein
MATELLYELTKVKLAELEGERDDLALQKLEAEQELKDTREEIKRISSPEVTLALTTTEQLYERFNELYRAKKEAKAWIKQLASAISRVEKEMSNYESMRNAALLDMALSEAA